jgi:hypothetical protein
MPVSSGAHSAPMFISAGFRIKSGMTKLMMFKAEAQLHASS